MTESDENRRDQSISKLRKLLKHRGHERLADLLKYSYSFINESTTFGRRWGSFISTFEIHSPLSFHESLMEISAFEKNELHKCLLSIHPPKDNCPDIKYVEFFPDVDLIPDSDLIETDNLKTISFEYIQDQIRKCKEKIENIDYDGAITNARTLIETTCLYILEKHGVAFDYKGKIQDLHKETAKVLKMESNLYEDNNLKKIINGAITIVDGVGSLRNSYSDAHGIAPNKKYILERRHAVLVVNLSKTISEFLYSSWSEMNQKK